MDKEINLFYNNIHYNTLTHVHNKDKYNNNKNVTPYMNGIIINQKNINTDTNIYSFNNINKHINENINENTLSRLKLEKLRVQNANKLYDTEMNLKILVWNIRSVNNDWNVRERKLNFIKSTIIKTQPEIVYIIDANKQILMNPAFQQFFDNRNLLLVRKEIQTNIIMKENLIIDNKNKIIYTYLPPNKYNKEIEDNIVKWTDNGYIIIGDFNLNSNKQINKIVINNNLIVTGEQTAQTLLINGQVTKNAVQSYVTELAPSDHQLIIFILRKKITSKSFRKVITNIPPEQKINQIWNLLQGKQYKYEPKLVYSKIKFNRSELQVFINVALNQFLHNNSHFAYVLLANKYSVSNFLGQLELYPKIVEEWKEYMKHEENKKYKQIIIEGKNEQITNTFSQETIEELISYVKALQNNDKLDYEKITKKTLNKLLNNFKRFKSNAKNEEQITIKNTSDNIIKYFTFQINFKSIEQACENIQNILRNVIKLCNLEKQSYFKGETFFIKKKKEIIEQRKDTRLIYISPIIMTVFEGLVYKETSEALNTAIKSLTKSAYGGVDGGSTYAFIYNLTFDAQVNKAKALFITDITTGYDAIDFDILDSLIMNDKNFNEREKFLLTTWSAIAYNLDIWIGNTPVKKTRGIAMGFALSPLIFVYYVANALKEYKYQAQIFTYIDDITIILYEKDEFFEIVNTFIQAIKKFKLEINLEKSSFLIELHGRNNILTKIELDELKTRHKEFQKIKVESSTTILGREIILADNEVVGYDDKYISIVNNNIKAVPKWLPLMIKKIIFDGAYTAKIRYIALMLASKNNDKIMSSFLKKAWNYYKIGTDKFSYEELLFRSWNIFRLSMDTIIYRNMVINIHNKLIKSKVGIETLEKMCIIETSEKKFQDLVKYYGLQDKLIKINMPVTRKWNPAVVYSDGSFNEQTNTYGCGAYIAHDSGSTVLWGYGKLFKQHRNVAGELLAVIKAIETCIERNVNIVKVCYDYTGIENWAEGRWNANTPLTIKYKNKIKHFKKVGIKIKWEKVKAHSGIVGNETADKLAKKGAETKSEKLKDDTILLFTTKNFPKNTQDAHLIECFQEEIKNLKNKEYEDIREDKEKASLKIFWEIHNQTTQEDIKKVLYTNIKQIDEHIKTFRFNINNRYIKIGIEPNKWRTMWYSQIFFLNKTWIDFLNHVIDEWVKRKEKEKGIKNVQAYIWQMQKFSIHYKFVAKFNWLSQIVFFHATFSRNRTIWFDIALFLIKQINQLFFKKKYLKLLNFNLLNEINEWRSNAKKKPFYVITYPKTEDIFSFMLNINTMEEFITEEMITELMVDDQGNIDDETNIEEEMNVEGKETNTNNETDNKNKQETTVDAQDQIYFNSGKKIIYRNLRKIYKRKSKSLKWKDGAKEITNTIKAKKLRQIKRDVKALLFSIDLIWNKSDEETNTQPEHILWTTLFQATLDFDRINQLYGLIEGNSFDPPCENWVEQNSNNYIDWQNDEDRQEEKDIWSSIILSK